MTFGNDFISQEREREETNDTDNELWIISSGYLNNFIWH